MSELLRNRVGPGMQVTLHFSLLLESGHEIDGTRDGKAASFTVGDGNLPEAIEEAIFGFAAGDAEQIMLPPERAFGEVNPANIQRIPRVKFGPDMALEEGLMVSFADPGEGELPGVVKSFTDDMVTVDFNHPLAGRTLIFDVSILRVEPE